MSRPPATQYSIHLQVTLENIPGVLGRLATEIGAAGGNIFAVDAFVAKGTTLDRDMVVNCSSVEHQHEVVAAVENTPGVTLRAWWDRTFRKHEGAWRRPPNVDPMLHDTSSWRLRHTHSPT